MHNPVSERWRYLRLLPIPLALGLCCWLLVLVPGSPDTLHHQSHSSRATRGEPALCTLDSGFAASYDLQLQASTRTWPSALLGLPDTDAPTVERSQVTGTLEVSWAGSSEAGALLAWQLKSLQAHTGQAPPRIDLERLEGQTAYTVLRRDCKITRFGFDARTTANDANHLQGLIQQVSLELQAPANGGPWHAVEYDVLGKYSAHYVWLGDDNGRRLRKTPQVYLQVHHNGRLPAEANPEARVLAAESVYEFAGPGQWLEALDQRAHVLVTVHDGALLADLQSQLHLQRRSDFQPAVRQKVVPALRYRDPGQPLPQLSAARPDPDESLRGLEALAALAQFSEQVQAGTAAARSAAWLAEYLRANPEQTSQLLEALLAGHVPQAAEPTFFLALELCGTSASRAALVEVLQNQDHSVANRVRAASALADTKPATTEALATLEQLAMGEAQAAPETPAERLVRNAATYGLGAFEAQARQKTPALAAAARDAIRDALRDAQTSHQRAAALDAIGNSGNSTLLPELEPLWQSSDPLARRHAIHALRRMDPDASVHHFEPLLLQEDRPAMRALVVETFAAQAAHAGRPASAAVLEFATEQLQSENDSRVREELLKLLGAACPQEPSACAALSTQFGRETEPKLLRLIGHYVPAEQLGS